MSLIHASQMLTTESRVKFFGMTGKDETAGKIVDIVRKTPLNIDNYAHKKQPLSQMFSPIQIMEKDTAKEPL